MSSLASFNEQLSAAEAALRQRETDVENLRLDLRTVRMKTSSLYRQSGLGGGASPRHFPLPPPVSAAAAAAAAATSATATDWNSLRTAMRNIVFFGASSNSKSCTVDSVLAETNHLTAWFSNTCVPQMHKWQDAVAKLEQRLETAQRNLHNPRLRPFCRDLRRRARLTSLWEGNSDMISNINNSAQPFLADEFRRIAVDRESANQERRRFLSEMNVRIARAQAVIKAQQQMQQNSM